jgi:AAHS family 4-hydroxybenzoate transporter-like MFS transporter
MVFFVCGAATLVLAVFLQFTLPESLRWLVAKERPRAKIAPLVSRFDPAVDPGRYESFYLSDEARFQSGATSEQPWIERTFRNFTETMQRLFKGALAFITPVIWFTYFFSSFAIYLKASFGVLFMEALGIERTMAANIASIGGLIGAIGGVMLLMFTEKKGPIWIALAPLVGIPLALLIGSGLIDGGALFVPILLIGSITIGAGHAAVISMTSIYYPSVVRSTGGGWASFMAKFAAVAAPIVGGYWFLADRRAVLDGYVFTALCLAGVVIGIVALAYFAKRLMAEQAPEELVPAEAQPAE